MPYTKLGKKPANNEKLQRLLLGTAAGCGYTNLEVGKMIGRCDDYAGQRLHNPGRLTVDELIAIGKQMRIPIEDLRAAITY